MKKLVVLLVILATLVSGYIFLFQPHITFEEVRVSDQAEEVKAVFVNVTGDPLCAKLYKLDHMDNNNPVASKIPLFIALPNGEPSPVDGNLGYADNIYILKGYNYQYEERNRLTGAIKKSPSHRFDVIAWEIITPYKKWQEATPNEGEIIEAETATDPISYKFDLADSSPGQFVNYNYVDCLAGQ